MGVKLMYCISLPKLKHSALNQRFGLKSWQASFVNCKQRTLIISSQAQRWTIKLKFK